MQWKREDHEFRQQYLDTRPKSNPNALLSRTKIRVIKYSGCEWNMDANASDVLATSIHHIKRS